MTLSCAASRDVVESVISELLGCVPVDGWMVRDALRCRVTAVDGPTVQEVLDRPATVEVYWLVDHKSEVRGSVQEARVRMLEASARLAVAVDAEAALTLGFERLILRREAGVLTVHRWALENLEPQRLEGLPPHELTNDDGFL